ncbi:hypothetical protein [Nitrososphaera viennensis]|uniref:Uncharacterized protein n=1 Tax=Nitrososphaera viennensis TaxID=1034015 RepID=A0A977IC98_9ARCH|nr:hypothetical protein [Nitrososphaera viennensis]UVS68349.1 hypothetical protein NWT39_10615 [Nitrososphaera viennensis]
MVRKANATEAQAIFNVEINQSKRYIRQNTQQLRSVREGSHYLKSTDVPNLKVVLLPLCLWSNRLAAPATEIQQVKGTAEFAAELLSALSPSVRRTYHIENTLK